MSNLNQNINSNQNDAEKNKKKRLVVYTLLAIVIIILAFLLGRCSGIDGGGGDPTRPTINPDAPTIDGNAGEYTEPSRAPGEAGGRGLQPLGRR